MYGHCATALPTNTGISTKRIFSSKNAATAISLAALSAHGIFPPLSTASNAMRNRGNFSISGCSKVSVLYDGTVNLSQREGSRCG